MAAQVSPSLAPLLLFARISGLLAAALVISWALVFKSSFLPQSTSQEDLIYAVLHPLLMVIGFILISGEVVDGFRELLASREMRTARITVLPWHIFLGPYTYGLAVATAETGLLQKITFLANKERRCPKNHAPESHGC
ncbi:cytochrome b-561 [Populus alba x Populus x berolinensis]|nr:cytochrome b-561 [Populus alba x Populus x berolinensis]